MSSVATHPAFERLRPLLARETRHLNARLLQHDRVLWVSILQQESVAPAEQLHLWLAEDAAFAGGMRAPIDAWPFRDRCFDHIVLQHALDFSPVVAVLVAEALRVLKPERELWIAGFGPWSAARFRLGFQLRSAPLPFAPPSLGQLKVLLASHGCIDVQARVLSDQDNEQKARVFSSRYLLSARKREIRPMKAKRATLLKPKAGVWSPRPTTRQGEAA